MFIEIEDLKEEPLDIQHVYAEGEISFRHDEATLAEPVSVDFTLTHSDRELRLGGSVGTSVRYACSRCLGAFTRRVSASFNLLYVPQPDWRDHEDEIALKYDDMDVGFYDGIRLDVNLMVLEQIELAIPMRFICQEECRGLCPNCGADLNRGACKCEGPGAESRMAALLDFKKKFEK